MTRDESATPVREIAGSWPADVSAAALISRADGGRLPPAAVDLMEALARERRPAILVSLDSEVDLEDLGPEDGEAPGLAAAVQGEVTLREAARPVSGRSFAFISAGAATDARALLEAPALARLARGIRAADGILLVHVPPHLEATPPVWMQGRVSAGAGARAAAFGAELRDLGGIPSTAAADSASRPETEGAGSGRWRRHRKEPRIPWGRIAAAAAVIAVLAAGWWLLARETVPSPEAAGGAPDAAAVESDSAGAGKRAAATRGNAEPADTTQSRVEGGSAAPLPYSVLVASFGRASDAASRVQRLRDSLRVPVYAAPTPVGDRLYHRVLAGVLSDTAAAGTLMRDLADRGLKSSRSPWDLRPVRLAFLLGRYATDSAAGRARTALGSAGVYAYLLQEPGTGDSTYVLYAGGYETREAAAALQEILDSEGHEAQLMIRRGESR